MLIYLFLLLVCLVLPLLAWQSHRHIMSPEFEPVESASSTAFAIQSLMIHGLVAGLAAGAAWSAGLVIPWYEGTNLVSALPALLFLFGFLHFARTESKRPLNDRDVLRKRLRAEGLSKPWLLVMLTASFAEEYAYRGVLYSFLVGFVPAGFAITISAIVFGLGHYSQGPRGAVLSGAFALAMSVLFVLSGTLALPILVHLFYDVAVSWMGTKLAAEDSVVELDS